MITLSTLSRLLVTYGYLAVLVVVALESMGLPAPGETMLLAASVLAGTTHALSLPLVIGAAATGAIVGDNLGYGIGSMAGARLFHRFGPHLWGQERKLKVGLYLFRRHGGTVVFFGRFVTLLRMWAALLAGVTQMRWCAFLCWNALGGLLWATGYGLLGYLLGANVERVTAPVRSTLLVLGCLVMVALFVLMRKYERRFEAEAAQLFPGPVEIYLGRTARDGSKPNRGRSPGCVARAFPHASCLRPLSTDGEARARAPLPLPHAGLAPPARPRQDTSEPATHRRWHPVRLEPFPTISTTQKGPST